jgi:hypothetical protein
MVLVFFFLLKVLSSNGGSVLGKTDGAGKISEELVKGGNIPGKDEVLGRFIIIGDGLTRGKNDLNDGTEGKEASEGRGGGGIGSVSKSEYAGRREVGR